MRNNKTDIKKNEIKKYREEIVYKWTDKKNAHSVVYLYVLTKSR
jgi:hypothetical protein